MSWFRQAARYRGEATLDTAREYLPNEFRGDPTSIYQSRDFPHVFLGGSSSEDIRDAAKRAGVEPEELIRFNVATKDTKGIDKFVPRAYYSTDLPEAGPATGWMMDESIYGKAKESFEAAADALAQTIVSTDSPIYVHCAMGMNRSVAVLAAALTKLTDRGVADILREMKGQRFVIAPHDAYYLMALEYSKNEEPGSVREWAERLDWDVREKNDPIKKLDPKQPFDYSTSVPLVASTVQQRFAQVDRGTSFMLVGDQMLWGTTGFHQDILQKTFGLPVRYGALLRYLFPRGASFYDSPSGEYEIEASDELRVRAQEIADHLQCRPGDIKFGNQYYDVNLTEKAALALVEDIAGAIIYETIDERSSQNTLSFIKQYAPSIYERVRAELGEKSAGKWNYQFKVSQFTGEVFIDSMGNVMGADDWANHESHALESKISDEVLTKYNVSDPESLFYLYQQGQMDPMDVEDIGKDFLDYMSGGGEARSWMVDREGWVRVHGANFEVGQLNGQTVDSIASYVYEETGGQAGDYEISIEETSSGNFANFSAQEILEAADDPGKLSRVLMRMRSRMGHQRGGIWRYAYNNIHAFFLIGNKIIGFNDFHADYVTDRFKIQPSWAGVLVNFIPRGRAEQLDDGTLLIAASRELKPMQQQIVESLQLEPMDRPRWKFDDGHYNQNSDDLVYYIIKSIRNGALEWPVQNVRNFLEMLRPDILARIENQLSPVGVTAAVKEAAADWAEADLLKMVTMAFDYHPIAERHAVGRFFINNRHPISDGHLLMTNENGGELVLAIALVRSRVMEGFEGWFYIEKDGERFVQRGPIEWSTEQMRQIPNDLVKRVYREIDEHYPKDDDDNSDEPTFEPGPAPTVNAPVPSIRGDSHWSVKLADGKPMALPGGAQPRYETYWGSSKINRIMTQEQAEAENQKYPGMQYLGEGANGIVFEHNGTVIKYSRDGSEAMAALHAMKTKCPCVVKVFEVREVKPSNSQYGLYAIRAEKLVGMKGSDPRAQVIDEVMSVMKYPSSYGVSIKDVTPEVVAEHYVTTGDEHLHLVSQTINLAHCLLNHGFELVDVAGVNVGWDEQGNLKLLDLGFSFETGKGAYLKDVNDLYHRPAYAQVEAKPMALPTGYQNNTWYNNGATLIDNLMTPEQAEREETLYPGMRHLGHGQEGIAFAWGDSVIKYTSKEDEVRAAQIAQSTQCPCVARIYEVRQVEPNKSGKPVYAIRMERLSILPYEEGNLTDETLLFLNRAKDEQVLSDITPDSVWEAMYRRYALPKTNPGAKDIIQKAVRFGLCLWEHGFDIIDMHRENFGVDGSGNLKVLDMGRIYWSANSDPLVFNTPLYAKSRWSYRFGESCGCIS